MQTKTVDVPEELLDLLRGSRLGERSAADQVKIVLAIHLFLEGLISVGRAAELAAVPRLEFEALLVEMSLPTVQYDLPDYYDQDLQGIAQAEGRSRAP
jgi:predicted HTH domain antitoxin